MLPTGDLIECANCDCWFAGASLDEVFYHGTCACRRELENALSREVPGARDS